MPGVIFSMLWNSAPHVGGIGKASMEAVVH